ncbi:hypothetical protein CVM73_11260 [Bradyrhizobium forestalis]|uniref:Uncharacterized protein n=1 Tax=Bradyrhizobium forestalis TaxID=1419263 RepID=A0A2M8RBF3_9BRAD|nr:hypothetical protein CVM73_11260 [Bradyrhizobium forestalis]
MLFLVLSAVQLRSRRTTDRQTGLRNLIWKDMVLISLWLGKKPSPSRAHATFARMKGLHVKKLISRRNRLALPAKRRDMTSGMRSSHAVVISVLRDVSATRSRGQ